MDGTTELYRRNIFPHFSQGRTSAHRLIKTSLPLTLVLTKDLKLGRLSEEFSQN